MTRINLKYFFRDWIFLNCFFVSSKILLFEGIKLVYISGYVSLPNKELTN